MTNIIPQTPAFYDLQIVKEQLYDLAEIEISCFEADSESKAYSAATFKLDGVNVVYRKARITATKTGQFVTLWKRDKGVTAPYDSSDPIHLVVISVRKDDRLGQFIFPQEVLISKGIISDNRRGKTGFRVYPPWDEVTNAQARQTQAWQNPWFAECNSEGYIQFMRIMVW